MPGGLGCVLIFKKQGQKKLIGSSEHMDGVCPLDFALG